MGRLTARLLGRLAQTAAVALLVATVCFAGLQALPGDLALAAAAARYGDDRVSAANVEILRREAGLNRPVAAQYAAWMTRFAAGDLGRSMLSGKTVAAELGPRLGATLLVGGVAAVVAVLLAVPLGIAAGVRAGGWVDRATAWLAAMLSSAPAFVVATLLIALLAIRLQWLPPTVNGSAGGLVLPAATLALTLLPGLARVVRHAVAGVVDAPFTVFARMRGVSVWAVALRVAARPALVPIVAYAPVLAMQLLEGFVTVELVFNIDGIGTLMVRALLGRDLPVVMGAGVAFVLMLAAANLATDVLLAMLDPRRRAVGA